MIWLQGYTTIAGEARGELTEKRSRFLGLAVPAEGEERVLALVAGLRVRHREARHHCWAYLLKTGHARYSDDGEPS
ncbi:MAG: YigZ family protein, partial [Oscillospiraceae bacterium]|nr:YigZ family protein [Oscillospiraceae bacterium]